jgi:hypothetical protein
MKRVVYFVFEQLIAQKVSLSLPIYGEQANHIKILNWQSWKPLPLKLLQFSCPPSAHSMKAAFWTIRTPLSFTS